MTYEQLKHAIRAACDVSGDTELLVFGSQAILGTWPDAPEGVRASIEVDMQAKNLPENTIFIDASLGEESQFHSTHGFYVHGVSGPGTTMLPLFTSIDTVCAWMKSGLGGSAGE